MNWTVSLNLGSGNLQCGCEEITAQVSLAVPTKLAGRSSVSKPLQIRGSLPPAPEIEQLYRQWKLLYQEFYRERSWHSIREIKIESGGITYFSEVEFNELCEQLIAQLNKWLDNASFHAIDRKLSRILEPTAEIKVIIETNDPILRRLPWHLWNFFEDYPQAELALSTLEYGYIRSQPSRGDCARILAIFGDDRDLDLKSERQIIKDLPHATTTFLELPQLKELNERLWDRAGWDILFFAGHSQTEVTTGQIFINETETITLEQLRLGLKKAIARGLKLAIFNSCDGLGLAQSLADLHIPQTIVMRESIPNQVAQEFFRYFLAAFARGESLYAAVREARERLEPLEIEYPCATWLPVICQNPAAESPTWKDLTNPSDNCPHSPAVKQADDAAAPSSGVHGTFTRSPRQMRLGNFTSVSDLMEAETPTVRGTERTDTDKPCNGKLHNDSRVPITDTAESAGANLLYRAVHYGKAPASSQGKSGRKASVHNLLGKRKRHRRSQTACETRLTRLTKSNNLFSPTPTPTHKAGGQHRYAKRRKITLPALLLASLIATSLVTGLRQLGALQSWELAAYDRLLNLRPPEAPDPRLLIVTVTEEDVQNQPPQERLGASISDRSFLKLLRKLQSYQPKVIGLDIYRESISSSRQANFTDFMQETDNLIAVCQVEEGTADGDELSGTRVLPQVSPERSSFSDLPLDEDSVIRRQLVGMSADPKSVCTADIAFSMQVAQTYFRQEGKKIERNSQRNLQVNDLVLRKLDSQAGGYHDVDSKGYQLLLNYRASPVVAETVTLAETIDNANDKQLEDLVKDKIVLIGTTAPSFNDCHLTPMSRSGKLHMPGVMIHAHMVSQILSAVEDNRPLLTWLPEWAEIMTIWGCALMAGFWWWCFRSPTSQRIAFTITILLIPGIGYIVFLSGVWLPIIPGLLAATATTRIIAFGTKLQSM